MRKTLIGVMSLSKSTANLFRQLPTIWGATARKIVEPNSDRKKCQGIYSSHFFKLILSPLTNESKAKLMACTEKRHFSALFASVFFG